MITTALLTLAIVTQDNTSLRAAPRGTAAQQAALWQGDTLEVRGQRLDYLQVYDHRRERAGFVHISQVRQLPTAPQDAPELLAVVRFLKHNAGSEALGIGYTAAYLKAAPAASLDAEVFDALGTLAERLARRASLKHPKNVADVISAHMEVAAFYGVTFKGYAQGYAKDDAVQLCYNGEAFRRVLSMAAPPELAAKAALAVTRHDCMSVDLHPKDRLAHDQWRAEVLHKINPAQFAQLSGLSQNRLRLRRADVASSLAFQMARRAEPAAAVAQQAEYALADLAAIQPTELTDDDAQDHNDTAIRVGASRWAHSTSASLPVDAAKPPKLAVRTTPGEAGQTCINLFETTTDGQPSPQPVASRCTYGVVWLQSANAHPNGQALALAVQPLATWREVWVFRKTAGLWAIDVLPPASSAPELGYLEFAGWTNSATHPNTPSMLLARETRIAGRYKRSFEVMRLDSLTVDKQASDASLLAAFGKNQDASWKRQTVSLR